MRTESASRDRRRPRWRFASDWLGSPLSACLEARALAAPKPGLVMPSTDGTTLELNGALFQTITALTHLNPMLWTGDHTSDPYSTTDNPTVIRTNAPFSAKVIGSGNWKLTNPDGSNAGSGTRKAWDWSDWKAGTHTTPGATSPDVLFMAAHHALDETATPGTGPQAGDTVNNNVTSKTNGGQTYGGSWIQYGVKDTSTNPPSTWNSQNAQSGGLEIKGGFFIDHRTLTPPGGTAFFPNNTSFNSSGYHFTYEMDLYVDTGSGPKLYPLLSITNDQNGGFSVTRANGTGVLSNTYGGFGYITSPGVDLKIGTANVTDSVVNPVNNAGTFDFVIHPSGQTQSTYWANPAIFVRYGSGLTNTWDGHSTGEHTEMAMFEAHVTSISPHS